MSGRDLIRRKLFQRRVEIRRHVKSLFKPTKFALRVNRIAFLRRREREFSIHYRDYNDFKGIRAVFLRNMNGHAV